MQFKFDRRQLFTTAGFGIGGLMLPGGEAMAQTLLGMTGFTHSVASGEPGQDSVLLWTRYKPETGSVAKIMVEVSDTVDFAKIVAGGQMVTGYWRDHTVKITVDGLQPGRFYYFRFIAPDGSKSPIGRTKTLPAGKVRQFNLAIFSCSNLGYGEFNAYGHCAKRTDIDAVLHMGDYIYEYGRGGYDQGDFGKRIFPEDEIITLADYRLRYASYRSDPQLQAMHQNFPVIPNTDDHEGTNDAWEGGAQNHTADEGDWSHRRNAAMQVWREWLPVGETPWKTYEIGDLATYFRTDSRMVARSRPYDIGAIIRGKDMAKALSEFQSGPWQDASNTMLGTEQESWLYRAFARNKSTWSVLGSGTNMGYNYTPPAALDWLTKDAQERSKNWIRQGIAQGKAGLPYNMDNWGGYPKARSRLLAAAQRAGTNLVVVSGDSHNGWAFDLPEGGKPAGVEFGGHSVSSPGIENGARGVTPQEIERAMLAANQQELRFMDASNRGYMVLSLTPSAATNEWVYMSGINQKSLATKPSKKMTVRAGRNVLDAAS